MPHYTSIYDLPTDDAYSNKCVGGKCTHCGECCADMLPLTKGELEILKRYAKKHNLKEHRQAPFWDPKATDLTCPFRNQQTQQTQRCDVYPVRPLICKTFICSKELLQAHADRDEITKDRKIYSLRWEIFENPECVDLLTQVCLKAARLV